ncbi:S-layer homology domain-containing protein [Solibacillus isronensis]|uniref:S-layer homology domain-containing protein n=1 Tax=Solibacillus isronensis TaxID=412383 RepID=UPI0009A70E5F|nr:S-layer homology domain-containing protein [Solibacillus isronensis]
MANQPKKYKKFVATAATATLVASAIVPVASAASLSDIAGNTHEQAITALVDAGVINGYPDGTFQPNKTLTRSDVVKLLGKFLVSKGHEVPADYKTNVRFNDLTSASNDELLKYAAVVYDAGVFNGSNGNLLAADNITRENMAVVLVRAFDTLNNIDLVSYVQGQEYKKDVKDLFTAKSEARAAIEVLDFFDITNPAVANFNPKGSTTRGHFATFLYNTMNADFSAVTGVANSAVSEIKAINNTTVEVTFKETVENIEALDFTIDGLEVTNAVVKQTDAKTVVLTTAPQTGDTVYTLNVNAAKAGTFKGVSAVIPTAVTITTPSVQGKLGQQVTVKAQVTVAEGQSKAGIPVTLFVPGSADGLKAPVTVEAVTNAEGVATYTYTRYAATTDTVTAYASGDRSKFATGYVFWGVDTIVSIEEVTTGATINNGANKTYKVTYKNPTTGQPVQGKILNVSALENINVTADKAQNVTVNGVPVAQFSNNTITRAAQITTDAKGEATFTLSGNHATVTPVVFDATSITGTTSYTQTYSPSLLQATAPKVTFSALQAAYTIEMTREGGEIAAIGASNGGREYKVVVKDKDGKLAANEIVNVALNEDVDKVIATQTSAKFIDDSGSTQVFFTGDKEKQITVKTNSKGEATFVVGSDKVNDYVTPIAWIDINTSNATDAKLDNGEPTAIGSITHFQDQYVDGASLTAYNGNKATSKFNGNDTATFKLAVTNQSGLEYTGAYEITSASYTVTNTGAEDVEVNDKGEWKTVSPNRSITVAQNTDLLVRSSDEKTTSVKVIATGNAKYTEGAVNKTFAFTAKEATATFTKVGEIPTAGYTGVVTAFDTTNKTITLDTQDPVKYAGETGKTYVFKGQGNTSITDADAFLKIVKEAKVTVTYKVDGDTVTFTIINIDNTADGGATDTANQKKEADLKAINTAKDAVTATSTVSVVGEATDAKKLAAVKAHVVSQVNDSTVTVDVKETATEGKYTVTLSKGDAKATKDVEVTFVTSEIAASAIKAPLTVDETDLKLTFSSALAGFNVDTTSITAASATEALVDVTAEGNVIKITKAENADTDATALKSTLLEFDIDVNATGYAKTTITVEVLINSAGEHTVTLTKSQNETSK